MNVYAKYTRNISHTHILQMRPVAITFVFALMLSGCVEHELLTWLKPVSETEINDLVAKTVKNGSSNAVDRMMPRLASYVSRSVREREWGRETQPLKSLREQEGLRELLIQNWQNEVDKASEQGHSVVELSRFTGKTELPPSWTFIPGTLAGLYPNDPEVHEIVWQSHDSNHPESTLWLLTIGRFNTTKATEYCIEMLFVDSKDVKSFMADGTATTYEDDPSHIEFHANLLRRSAAQCLRRCQSSEGLAALVRRMQDLPTGPMSVAVVEAVVAHGEQSLPYQEQLRKIGQRHGASAESDVPEIDIHDFNEYSPDVRRMRLVKAMKELERLVALSEN